LLNFVNTTGEYIRSDVFDRKAEAAIMTGEIDKEEEAQYLAKLESGFLSIVNISTLLIQLLLVSRILKWFGVKWALLFLPFIALGGYFLIAFGATFIVVYWAKAMENSTDYSLMNTLRGALYLITSREEKYKAKAAIDTFFVRAGDVLVGITVFLGTTYFAFNTERFAALNVLIVLIWITLCFLIIREHKKLSEKRAFSPGE
jgi:AAA family ATP:ADP antiporter